MRRKLLTFLSALAFAFSIAGFSFYTHEADAERTAYFQEQESARSRGETTFSGPYCYPDRHPQFLLGISLLTGLTALSLFLFKKPFVPSLLALAAFSMYPFWYWDTQRAIAINESSQLAGLDWIIYRGNEFDVVVFVLISIVAVWQLCLIPQVVMDAIQRSRPLP